MSDTLTPTQRHNNMAAIHSKDTKPELVVRRYLWSHGFRYRLNHKRLPGKPDVVLRKYRTCVFINGCFWHGHVMENGTQCQYYRVPQTNTDFWEAKVARNKARDRKVQQQLAEMGWHCVTIWECELKTERREQTLESLAYTLNRIFLEDHKQAIPYVGYAAAAEEEYSQMAAEDDYIEYGVEGK